MSFHQLSGSICVFLSLYHPLDNPAILSSFLTFSFSRKSTGAEDDLDFELLEGNVDEKDGLAEPMNDSGEYEYLLVPIEIIGNDGVDGMLPSFLMFLMLSENLKIHHYDGTFLYLFALMKKSAEMLY